MLAEILNVVQVFTPAHAVTVCYCCYCCSAVSKQKMPKPPGKTRKFKIRLYLGFPGYFRVLPALDAGDRRGSLLRTPIRMVFQLSKNWYCVLAQSSLSIANILEYCCDSRLSKYWKDWKIAPYPTQMHELWNFWASTNEIKQNLKRFWAIFSDFEQLVFHLIHLRRRCLISPARAVPQLSKYWNNIGRSGAL